MIQRIQSVFLLGVAICMVVLLFSPIWEKFDTERVQRITLDAWSMVHTQKEIINGEEQMVEVARVHTFYIGILAIIAALVALYEIFQYNNRLTQMKLGALNSLLMSAVLGTSVYFIYQGIRIFAPDNQGNYQIGIILATIALFLNLLANRFIRRDENLVRSADRIR